MFLAKGDREPDAAARTIDTQMGLINKELTDVSGLVDKGMVVAPRQLALQRSVAQIQGDRLSMQTNKLRVQEEISKAESRSSNFATAASRKPRSTCVKRS